MDQPLKRRRLEMRGMQEAWFGESFDYRAGSPHLKHMDLRDRLVGMLRSVMRESTSAGLPMALLEIGAGHGGYTEPALASGWRVTATEMSRPSLDQLQRRFGSNEKFSPVLDPDGSLEVLDDQRFSVILCSSVLHHIPDYVEFIDHCCSAHLHRGGYFLSIQDPLWYPSLPGITRFFSKAAYFGWRFTRGQYRRGARTLVRRLRGVLCDDEPADTVEYHVVRNGVDQSLIFATLVTKFRQVRVIPYWSTQSRIAQELGEMANAKNTFAIVALGYDNH